MNNPSSDELLIIKTELLLKGVIYHCDLEVPGAPTRWHAHTYCSCRGTGYYMYNTSGHRIPVTPQVLRELAYDHR